MVEDRFEHSAQKNRMAMESQLSELTEVRSRLHNQQSERKSKAVERSRVLHDKSMENGQAQQYIASLPLQTASLPLETAVKRRL